MSNLSGSPSRVLHRARQAIGLLSEHGLATTIAVMASVVEDTYVRAFDRRYGVRTSGYIPLARTSLGQAAEEKGHRYRAVNAWGFRRLLAVHTPSNALRFVDLGCGLGRACLLAAEYQFSRVRGVDMVPEFCAQAKANVQAFCSEKNGHSFVDILLEDAVEYSTNSDDDIVFLFNPFPREVLQAVIDRLLQSAARRCQPVTIIYTQRILETSKTLEVLETEPLLTRGLRLSSWGQSFHVFHTRKC